MASELGRPRRGHMALAVCLGLLLLASGCVLTRGETGDAHAKKAAGGWMTGLSSLFGGVANASQQKETEVAKPASKTEESKVEEDEPQIVEKEEVEDFLKDVVGDELPKKNTGDRWSDEVMKQKMEQALKQPCVGDCVDDGHGNLIPASLFRAQRMRQISKTKQQEAEAKFSNVGRRALPTKMQRHAAIHAKAHRQATIQAKAQRQAAIQAKTQQDAPIEVKPKEEDATQATKTRDGLSSENQTENVPTFSFAQIIRQLHPCGRCDRGRRRETHRTASASRGEAPRYEHRDADCQRSDEGEILGAIGRSSKQCRCEYPGEKIFGGRMLTWGKAKVKGGPKKPPSAAPGVSSYCPNAEEVDGWLVYPSCHPACKNVKYICPKKTAWTDFLLSR